MTVKEALAQPPFDAWPKLKALGYTMQKVVFPTDRRGYASYRMLDNNIPVTEWEHDITWQAAVNRREQYAKMELQRLAELDKESE